MDEHSTPVPTLPGTTDQVPGVPSWVSLMGRDLRASQEFYGAVLDWEFQAARTGEEYTVALSRGAPIASIGALAPTLQMAVAWMPYFAVADADQTAARIRERSGTIAVGPLSFTLGRAALAADRDGAVFGLWAGELVHDWAGWREETPVWVRLRTRDAFDAAIFYGEIFGWATGRPGGCEVDYVDEEVVLRRGGHALARVSSGALEAAPDPLVRPHWHVCFRVPDVPHCVRLARVHGGTVSTQRTTPDGWEATLRDPDGALFTVTQARP